MTVGYTLVQNRPAVTCCLSVGRNSLQNVRLTLSISCLFSLYFFLFYLQYAAALFATLWSEQVVYIRQITNSERSNK